MEVFPQDTRLQSLQAYQARVCKARGWDKTTVLETFLLMSEEMGELARAIRKHRGLYSEKGVNKKEFTLAEEFADVFSYLLELANKFEIDLTEAYRKKEEINADRHWN